MFSYFVSYILIHRFLYPHTSLLVSSSSFHHPHIRLLGISYIVSYIHIFHFLYPHTSFLIYSYIFSYVLIHRFIYTHTSFLVLQKIVSGILMGRFLVSPISFQPASFAPSRLCGKKISYLKSHISNLNTHIYPLALARFASANI